MALNAAATTTSKTFRTGTKQVFLPRHTVTFLRPDEHQPPRFATFRVPLTFNKLDLRDYLLHVYNVPVLKVRSQLRQQMPRRSDVHHRIYRPPPVKTMTVELTEPFVWPERPEDKTPWNPVHVSKRFESQKQMEERQKRQQETGEIPLRPDQPAEPERLHMKRQARELLKRGKWENGEPLDPRFERK
ncbi:hypothetical protein F4778DRAFT_718597 [Xylariomycetidae sp. FL2044]|nr:hypothetical protein F4778DRAFT_718597 [Xylariomycetidae sp. FL2044]